MGLGRARRGAEHECRLRGPVAGPASGSTGRAVCSRHRWARNRQLALRRERAAAVLDRAVGAEHGRGHGAAAGSLSSTRASIAPARPGARVTPDRGAGPNRPVTGDPPLRAPARPGLRSSASTRTRSVGSIAASRRRFAGDEFASTTTASRAGGSRAARRPPRRRARDGLGSRSRRGFNRRPRAPRPPPSAHRRAAPGLPRARGGGRLEPAAPGIPDSDQFGEARELVVARGRVLDRLADQRRGDHHVGAVGAHAAGRGDPLEPVVQGRAVAEMSSLPVGSGRTPAALGGRCGRRSASRSPAAPVGRVVEVEGGSRARGGRRRAPRSRAGTRARERTRWRSMLVERLAHAVLAGVERRRQHDHPLEAQLGDRDRVRLPFVKRAAERAAAREHRELPAGGAELLDRRSRAGTRPSSSARAPAQISVVTAVAGAADEGQVGRFTDRREQRGPARVERSEPAAAAPSQAGDGDSVRLSWQSALPRRRSSRRARRKAGPRTCGATTSRKRRSRISARRSPPTSSQPRWLEFARQSRSSSVGLRPDVAALPADAVGRPGLVHPAAVRRSAPRSASGPAAAHAGRRSRRYRFDRADGCSRSSCAPASSQVRSPGR